MPEREKFNPEEGKDFTNEDVARRILESGTETELEKLRTFYNWEQEQTNLYRYYAQLRKETISAMKRDLEARKRENPIATQQELEMGAYVENIEPQVRGTVTALRAKGYNSILSGFSGLNSQEIRLADNGFADVQLDNDMVEKLNSRGIEVRLEPDEISFICNNELTVDELEKIWEVIEDTIPDLGKRAEVSQLPSAKTFRKKQKELK